MISIAKRYIGRGLDFEDLVQFGCLGIIRAADKFQFAKNCKFSTYATVWIRQRIVRGLDDTADTIRKPNNVIQRMNKLKGVYRLCKEDITSPMERPDRAKLCEVFNRMYPSIPRMTPEEAEELGGFMQAPSSLDDSVTAKSENLTMMDYIADDSDLTDIHVEYTSDQEKLMQALLLLPQEESGILISKYGLIDHKEKTNREIAEYFKLSVDDVPKLEKKILRKLRRLVNKNQINALNDCTVSKLVIKNCPGHAKLFLMERLREIYPGATLSQLSKKANRLPLTINKLTPEQINKLCGSLQNEGIQVEVR